MVYSCYDQKNINNGPDDSTLYIVDLLTGTKIPIARNAIRACWQGKTMIFVRHRKVAKNIFRDEIWATNGSPTSARRLWTSATPDSYIGGCPCLTWDGQKVIVDGRWLVDVATGKVKEFNPPRRLTAAFGLFIHLKGDHGEDLVLIQPSGRVLVLMNLEGKVIREIHRK